MSLPNILLYNSTCEMAVGNGLPYYQPPALVAKLESDLSFLMAYLAKPTDWVIVDDLPSDAFMQTLKTVGFSLPEFVLTERFYNDQSVIKTAKGAFKPWGISPAILKKCEAHYNSFSPEYRKLPMSVWQPIFRELFSRARALEVLKDLSQQQLPFSMLPKSHFPVICKCVDDVEEQLIKHNQVVLKAPWSSSGRGVLVLRSNHLNTSNKQWISGIIASQGYLMVERLLNKVADISFHFYINSGTVEFKGITTFSTSHNGQYLGSYLDEIPTSIKNSYGSLLNDSTLLIMKNALIQSLNNNSISTHYHGHLGVDALIYLDENNLPAVHPCLEINLRHNMGTITLALRDMFPLVSGYWKTIFSPVADLDKFCTEMRQKYPLIVKQNKAVEGFLPLTPINQNTKFASYIMLGTYDEIK